jgi:hypothetical protein
VGQRGKEAYKLKLTNKNLPGIFLGVKGGRLVLEADYGPIRPALPFYIFIALTV